MLERCSVAMVVTRDGLCPADAVMYPLRGRTGSVESTALVVASIASKHLAVPPHSMVLDVRYGSGAFFSQRADSEQLAGQIAEMLAEAGIPSRSLFTEMPQPNGMCVGAALEVAEAVAVMSPARVPGPFRSDALQEQTELVVRFFEAMMDQEFGEGPWRALALRALSEGRVLAGFRTLLNAHGVSAPVAAALVQDPMRCLRLAPVADVVSGHAGYLVSLDQRRLGTLANHIAVTNGGYGGVALEARIGDALAAGDSLARVWSTEEGVPASVAHMLEDCFCVVA